VPFVSAACPQNLAHAPRPCYAIAMPTGRPLSAQQLTEARRAYEAGQSYRALGSQYGVNHKTVRVMLAATGVTSRPMGWPQRPRSAPAAGLPQPCPAVEIAPDVTGRLRIPLRTPEERRCRAWTAAELQAIGYELRAGRFVVIGRGRSGLHERISPAVWDAARFAFWLALQKVRRAA
jgi:hypothetical protein